MARYNSKLACEWSVTRIPDPHLWTFTLPVLLEPRKAARMWSRLQRDLVRSFGMYGVRVFEPHPGGHGLHVHMVVSGRFEVTEIRPLAIRYGFGRVNVIPIQSPEYIAKYLTKSKRDGWDWRGLRLWAILGRKFWPETPTRVLDVVNESLQRRIYDRLKAVLRGVSDYKEAGRLYRCADWWLAGLVRPCIIRAQVEGEARHGLKFLPCFSTSAFEDCVFWRGRRRQPPRTEEERKGGAGTRPS